MEKGNYQRKYTYHGTLQLLTSNNTTRGDGSKFLLLDGNLIPNMYGETLKGQKVY
jgi:hypothetical protein